jgi:hypothetical protein
MRKVVIHPAQIPSKGDRPTDEGTSERGGGEGVRLAQEVIRALHMHRARAARAQGRDKTQRARVGYLFYIALFVSRAEPVARRPVPAEYTVCRARRPCR